MKASARILGLSLLLMASAALAQPPEAPDQDEPVSVTALIRQVADEIGRDFIIDPRIRGIQVMTTSDDIDYDKLLAILRVSGLVAIDTGEQIRIIPEQNVRTEMTRLLQEDDPSVSDHEVVTRVIRIPEIGQVTFTNEQGQRETQPALQATFLVPVLRPMMSQSAQLAAVPNVSVLILVDRYDNVRRITSVINEIIERADD
jgi:general secretion pathway protein D